MEPIEKNEIEKKVESLKLHHYKELIFDAKKKYEDIGFFPRMAFIHDKDKVIQLKGYELNKIKDWGVVYLEFTNRQFEPEDKNRQLYKFNIKNFYLGLLRLTKIEESQKYFVKVEDLEKVSKLPEEFQFDLYESKFGKKEESPQTLLELASNISIRDFCAIIWKEPISNNQELNNLIKLVKNGK